MTHPRHWRLRISAAQKHCSPPSLKRDIVPVAWTRPPTGGLMAIHIGRREFVIALGGAVAVWPVAARGKRAACSRGGSGARQRWN